MTEFGHRACLESDPHVSGDDLFIWRPCSLRANDRVPHSTCQRCLVLLHLPSHGRRCSLSLLSSRTPVWRTTALSQSITSRRLGSPRGSCSSRVLTSSVISSVNLIAIASPAPTRNCGAGLSHRFEVMNLIGVLCSRTPEMYDVCQILAPRGFMPRDCAAPCDQMQSGLRDFTAPPLRGPGIWQTIAGQIAKAFASCDLLHTAALPRLTLCRRGSFFRAPEGFTDAVATGRFATRDVLLY